MELARLPPVGLRATLGARGFTPEARGQTFYSRLTLIANGSTIDRAFFPVDDPQSHATEVVA